MAKKDYNGRFDLTPAKIKKMTTAEINKEYSRLRSIANKRIGRLARQGLTKNVTKFATIQQIKDSSKWDVVSQLAEVSRFLRMKESTVTGAKEKIDDFNSSIINMGYGNLVNSIEDSLKLMAYFDALREKISDKLYDSGDALDVYEQGQRLNIPVEKLIEHYEEFATNLSQMEKLKPSRNGKEFSQRRINNLIKKWSD